MPKCRLRTALWGEIHRLTDRSPWATTSARDATLVQEKRHPRFQDAAVIVDQMLAVGRRCLPRMRRTVCCYRAACASTARRHSGTRVSTTSTRWQRPSAGTRTADPRGRVGDRSKSRCEDPHVRHKAWVKTVMALPFSLTWSVLRIERSLNKPTGLGRLVAVKDPCCAVSSSKARLGRELVDRTALIAVWVNRARWSASPKLKERRFQVRAEDKEGPAAGPQTCSVNARRRGRSLGGLRAAHTLLPRGRDRRSTLPSTCSRTEDRRGHSSRSPLSEATCSVIEPPGPLAMLLMPSDRSPLHLTCSPMRELRYRGTDQA